MYKYTCSLSEVYMSKEITYKTFILSGFRIQFFVKSMLWIVFFPSFVQLSAMLLLKMLTCSNFRQFPGDVGTLQLMDALVQF